MHYDYDTAVIGAGVLGCFAARNLSRWQLSTILLEAREDICTGITRSNTAVIYPGYDVPPGTLKARLCVAANQDFGRVCEELGVPFSRCGSIMAGFGPRSEKFIKKRYQQGVENQVPGIRLLSGEEVRTMEPALSPGITIGLYAPGTGTVNPWELGIAACENARANGVFLKLRAPVQSIQPLHDSSGAIAGYQIHTSDGSFNVKGIINCAGMYADRIREMAAPPLLRIFPSKGDYYILDTTAGNFVNHIIFQESEEKGKGLNLVPTVNGNLLVGPSSLPCEDRDDYSVSADGLDFIRKLAAEEVPSLDLSQTIRSFAALRPNPGYVKLQPDGSCEKLDLPVNGFSFLEKDNVPLFLSLVGIKTPGLTCANELGKYCAERLLTEMKERDLLKELRPKKQYHPKRIPIPHPASMTYEDRRALTEQSPAYARVVCRCREITEGEIREAVRRGARTIGGVKRRTGSGTGRCQGSFCTEKIIGILSEELGCPPEDIRLETDGSWMIRSCTGYSEREPALSSDPAPSGHIQESGAAASTAGLPHYDLVVVGGGAAGMAAALAAESSGAEKILLADRNPRLGGILPQCIHSGFGQGYFGEDLTGPEYAGRFEKRIRSSSVEILTDTTVLSISPDHRLVLSGKTCGLFSVHASAVILATGCRERPVGSLPVSGTRPSGIFSAGAAQKLVNLHHCDLGNDIVILGSGDIGLIMARRFTLLGKNVIGIIEKNAECGGMKRNRVNCLEAFHIPLFTDSVITAIHGYPRITGVTVKNLRTGTDRLFSCDTLITAVGLIPERELIRPLLEPHSGHLPEWIRLCGNCEHVHEIVDAATKQAETVGRMTARAGLINRNGSD